MRQANLFMMSAAMLLAACGGTKDAGKTDQVLIDVYKRQGLIACTGAICTESAGIMES